MKIFLRPIFAILAVFALSAMVALAVPQGSAKNGDSVKASITVLKTVPVTVAIADLKREIAKSTKPNAAASFTPRTCNSFENKTAFSKLTYPLLA